MPFRRKYAIPLLAAAAFALGIGSAPIAAAAPEPNCEDLGQGVEACTTKGSTAISAEPQGPAEDKETYDFNQPLYDTTP